MTAQTASKSGGFTFSLGLFFIGIWLTGCFLHLNSERSIALSMIQECPIVHTSPLPESSGIGEKIVSILKERAQEVSDYYSDCQRQVRNKKEAVDAIFDEGIGMAIGVSPLLFFVSRFLSKYKMRRDAEAEQTVIKVEAERQRIEYHVQQEDRQRAILAEHASAKTKINRIEFIKNSV